jgi:hypothetical protein
MRWSFSGRFPGELSVALWAKPPLENKINRIGRKDQIDPRRTIGKASVNSRSVDSRRSLRRILRDTVSVLFVGVSLGSVGLHAQDAIWLAAPGSGVWNTAANWSPNTVPTGSASFGASNTTTITFSDQNTAVGTLQFNALAPAYTFNLTANSFAINGAGIINNSSNAPTFADVGVDTEISFNGASTAGNAIMIANSERLFTNFNQSSTAGNATIFASNGGNVEFFGQSTAGNATIFTSDGSVTYFQAGSTGGQAQLITGAGGTVDLSHLTSPGMTVGSGTGAR